MFGYNIQDKDGKPLFKEISFEQFEILVKEMVAYAKAQPPFNPHEAIAEANGNAALQSENVGPLVRIHGGGVGALASIEQYTHFIRIGIHALQVVYYEMEMEPPEVGRVGQVTLVDNYGMPLEKELVIGIFCMFFGEGAEVEFMETPPHVAVGVKVLEMD